MTSPKNFQYPQMQQSPQYQFFPQPQGLVYSINSSGELNNIPINTGSIVALCFPEEVCHIRTIQNGNPVISSFRITPYSQEEKAPEPSIVELLKSLDKRLKALEQPTEQTVPQKGGNLSEFL